MQALFRHDPGKKQDIVLPQQAEPLRDQPGFSGFKPLKSIGNQGRFQAVGFLKIVVVVAAQGDDFIGVPHHHSFGKPQDFVSDSPEFAAFPVNSMDGDHDFLPAQGSEKQKAGIAQGVKMEHIVAAPQGPYGCQKRGHQCVSCLFVNGEHLFHPNTVHHFFRPEALFLPDIYRYILALFDQLPGESAHDHIDSALTGGNSFWSDHGDFHGNPSHTCILSDFSRNPGILPFIVPYSLRKGKQPFLPRYPLPKEIYCILSEKQV